MAMSSGSHSRSFDSESFNYLLPLSVGLELQELLETLLEVYGETMKDDSDMEES